MAGTSLRLLRFPSDGTLRRWMRIRIIGRLLVLLSLFVPVYLLTPLLNVVGLKKLAFWWTLQALSFAGPCFIKLGQWIATRPDMFDEVQQNGSEGAYSFRNSVITSLSCTLEPPLILIPIPKVVTLCCQRLTQKPRGYKRNLWRFYYFSIFRV